MMREKARLPGWVLALLYLALAGATIALFSTYATVGQDELYLTPLLRDARGWEIYSLDGETRVPMTGEELNAYDGVAYLSRVLDPAFEEQGYTVLRLDGPVSVFLDGALLYTTHPGSGTRIGEVELPGDYTVAFAGESPCASLPTGYGGRTLTLAVGRGERAGMPMVILSSRAIADTVTAAGANDSGMPAAAFMAAAFLLLGLLLYGGAWGRWDLPLLLLALAAAFQSLYHLRAFSWRMNTPGALDVPAAALIPPLLVTLPLCWLLCRMKRRHRAARAVLTLLPAGAALAPALYDALALPFPDGVRPLCTAALFASIAVVLVCAVLELREGSADFHIFLAGLIVVLAALGAACLLHPPLRGYVLTVLRSAVHGAPELALYWCGVILFLLCGALAVFGVIRHMADEASRAELLTAQVSALRRRMEGTQAAEEALNIERHDLRHRLNVVADLVERDERQEALAFIGASQAQLDALKQVRWCRHPVLDAVFHSYFEQARREGVSVEASIDLPDELPYDAAELSTVFANTLENAIHACAALPEGERRLVCKCLSRPTLMFEVANTCARGVCFDEGGLPVSQRQGHGFGVRSIAAFCAKHGVTCTFEERDGWFRVRLIR